MEDNMKVRDMYLEEMSHVVPCTEDEMNALFPEMHNGNQAARNRLIEGNMHLVMEAASYFESEQVLFMDLVQEGNLALMMKLQEIEKYDGTTEGQLMEAIHEALRSYVSEEGEEEKAGEELAVRLNVIDEICVRIAEDTGREATAEEIAEKMQMDPDDVKYLMRIALNAIKKD